MNYKMMMLCAVIGSSMQSAHGMEKDQKSQQLKEKLEQERSSEIYVSGDEGALKISAVIDNRRRTLKERNQEFERVQKIITQIVIDDISKKDKL